MRPKISLCGTFNSRAGVTYSYCILPTVLTGCIKKFLTEPSLTIYNYSSSTGRVDYQKRPEMVCCFAAFKNDMKKYTIPAKFQIEVRQVPSLKDFSKRLLGYEESFIRVFWIPLKPGLQPLFESLQFPTSTKGNIYTVNPIQAEQYFWNVSCHHLKRKRRN